MTKADIVNEISKNTGIEKALVLATVEQFMDSVKSSLAKGDNVYLRGFGSFIVKKELRKLQEISLKIRRLLFRNTISRHLNLLKLSWEK